MPGLIVVPGLRVGKLTVIKEIDKSQLPDHIYLSYRNQGQMYECDCDCGKKAYWPEILLSYGKIKSCGCLRASALAKAQTKRQAENVARNIKRELTRLQRERNLYVALGTWDHHQKDIGPKIKACVDQLRKLGVMK